MFRAITISREYGSGGGMIGEMLAQRVGWKLLDRRIVNEVAERAKVAPAFAARLDEQVDPWFYRLVKALWNGGFEAAPGSTAPAPFDSEAMARMTAEILREAARAGECVIVGRASQCVLRGDKDVFHASVFGPHAEKIQRVRSRLAPGADAERVLREVDRQRAAYIQRFYGENWKDRRLYHLTVTSGLGLEAVVATVLCAAGLSPKHS
jgi:cytidylate kinase